MEDPLVISLLVSGIGMLMLFLALAILYGLMVLMTRMTGIRRMPDIRAPIKERVKEAGGRRQEAGGKEQEARRRKRRVAVIAVALARVEGELSAVSPSEREEGVRSWPVSRWWAFHHQRQLTRNVRARRGR